MIMTKAQSAGIYSSFGVIGDLCRCGAVMPHYHVRAFFIYSTLPPAKLSRLPSRGRAPQFENRCIF